MFFCINTFDLTISSKIHYILDTQFSPRIQSNKPSLSLTAHLTLFLQTMQHRCYIPAFAFFCNLPQYVREDYKRFIENRIRENWDFTGVPIEIYFRKK